MKDIHRLGSALAILAAGVNAQQRCDLVTRTSKCLDLVEKNRALVTVPANTTRIPTDGLVLCGVPGSTPPPTDIVYIVDQSSSMVPTFIVPGTEDTSGWFSCKGGPNGDLPAKWTNGYPSLDFHGNTVQVANPSTPTDTMEKYCRYADGSNSLVGIAGDPYSVRANAVYAAIRNQAARSPGSSAATINFNHGISTTQDSMTRLDPAGVAGLTGTVPLVVGGWTNYEAPLEWARILLYGGTSSTGRKIPPSPGRNKAIILISDGVPNDGIWQRALDRTDTLTVTTSMFPGDPNAAAVAGKWRGDSGTIAPIYGIYLGTGDAQDSVLTAISGSSGGSFYQIPPYMPDSLGLVIDRILGHLIQPAKPDTLVVRNLANGQKSTATVSVSTGTGYRMRLDSLVGLELGSNLVEVSVGQGGTTVLDTLTIDVAGTTTSGTLGLDTSLTTRCSPASSLALRPDRSGLPYAIDSADRAVLAVLRAAPDVNSALPLVFSTWKSGDVEPSSIAVPSSLAGDSLHAFLDTLPWQGLAPTGSLPGDGIVRSGPGLDSVRARFQMPRDARDTAYASLALRRAVSPSLSLTPSVQGPAGVVQVVVVDSNTSAPSIRVGIRHRQGDSLSVVLVRTGPGTYLGSFTFAQGQPVDLSDTLLEIPSLGVGPDSIDGFYQNLTARTRVSPAPIRLRFLDPQGFPRDSLGFDLAQGQRTAVTVQLWIGPSPCSNCGGLVAVASSDPGLGVVSASGTPLSSVRLAGGLATVYAYGFDPVRMASISFSSDSLGTSLSAQPVRVLPVPPDSVVYLDQDGDGALDRAVVDLRRPWTPGSEFRLPWPDSAHILPTGSASVSMAPDSSWIAFDFPPRSPDTTSWKIPSSAWWRYDSTWPWQSVPIAERIAPVPLRAVLSWGTRFDTLRVFPSEPISPDLSNLAGLVGRFLEGSTRAVLPQAARIETSTGALLLLIPSDSTGSMVRPGDSARFLASVKDGFGNAPGPVSKRVVVEGSDPPPLDAVLVDSDADGRADRVVLRLRWPLSVTDTVGFLWPDTNGILESRSLPPSAGIPDSTGTILTFSVDPFGFGATSCPATGCAALGSFSTSRFGRTARTSFPVRDGVDPIPTRAIYRYSSDDLAFDTLVVRFSEPLRVAGDSAQLSVGRPGIDSLGTVVRPSGGSSFQLAPDGRSAWILVDTASPIHPGDSLRITSRTVGGTLSDTAGNTPGRAALWAPIDWGMPPAALTLSVPHPVVRAGNTAVPPGEDAVSVVVRTPGAKWRPLEGPALSQDDLDHRIGGVAVHLNRIPQTLGMYVYDHLGVMVLRREVTDLSRQSAQGNLATTRRGDYDLWLTWNGLDGTGRPAASGIYSIRVFGWFSDKGELLLLNQVRNTGFYRKTGD